MSRRKTMILAGALLGLLMLAGCQATTGLYHGARADAETVVELPDGKQSGQHWKDLYLQVDYSLQRDADRLTIKGSFSYTQSTKTIFQQVHDLKLKLYLVDSEQRVVAYREVARALGNRLDNRISFSEVFDLPPGVTGMTFGYEGIMLNEEKRGEMIWKLPDRSAS